MRIGNLLWIICGCLVWASCSENDDRDDTVLDMSALTGKYWYYNQWWGNRDNYAENDLLQVLKFEKNGNLMAVDLGGRNEQLAGVWTSANNEIRLAYTGQEPEVWKVLHSGSDYIQAIINGQGQRDYTSDAGWLEDLTADAFLVNEYSDGNLYQTRIGGEIRGNRNVREADLIVAAGKVIPMQSAGYFWCERKPVAADYIDADAGEREARFYIRIGQDGNLKLRDVVSGDNIPGRPLSEVGLKAGDDEGIGMLRVEWNPYLRGDIYYRIEIYSKDMDIVRPYFISKIQPAGNSRLAVKSTTAGEVNRVGEMKSGDSYILRLAAILYESGTDVVNDNYGYANVQAITYVTIPVLWK